MKTIAYSLLALIAMCLFIALTGCTLTIGADGSKAVTVDGAAVAKIIAEK